MKDYVAPAYARDFILEFCQRATDDGWDDDPNSEDNNLMIEAALRSVRRADDTPAELAEGSSSPATEREYNRSKVMSGKILLQIKGIVDSVLADAVTMIDSDKQELKNLESLLKELAEKTGNGANADGLLHDVCSIYFTKTHGSMEANRQKVQSLSKFLNGAIEILRGPY